MAIITNTLQRSSVIGVREELQDAISNISPVDVKFSKMIGKYKVGNTFFEWQTDELAAPANNTQVDGDDTAFAAVVQPARVGNYTQISKKSVIIGDTSDVINKDGRKSELAYQIDKQTKELKRDIEFALLNNKTHSSSATRQTAGVQGWLETNCSVCGGAGAVGVRATNTAPVAGTNRTFTLALVKTQIQNCFTQGGEPSVLMVTPAHKVTFSGETFNATRFAKAESAAMHGAVDVYVNDFGELKVIPSRILAYGDTNAVALLLDPSQFSMAELRPVKYVPLAKTGDAEKAHVICEYGLKVGNQKASAQIRDLTP